MSRFNNYWLGSEEDFFELDAQVRRVLMSETALPTLRGGLDEFGPNPIQTEVVDGVGIMHIRGSMMSEPSWFTRLLGIVTYREIQESLIELGNDEEVKVILQNWDSPGGMARGCKRCAEFTRKYAENIKPVHSFTEGMAASAAIWNYSAGLLHFADEDAELGSVGVILVHSEITEMDKQLGITRKVFRSAPYKALGGPYEKLTEEGEKQIEEGITRIHNQFATGISVLNDIPLDKVNSGIANGKLFLPDQARRLGLVDKVLSLGQVVRKLARGAKPRK